MTTFNVTSEFLLDNEPFKIISGALHYFRVHPDYWEHSLYNLKAMGCNTVETYIPWNLHEPKEGEFDFSEGRDINKFITLAEELGLYVIVRPSPFICAEWEFGGLPGWLLNYPDMIYRTADSLFLEKVAPFYHEILTRLKPQQVTEGGPILMLQVENEYGSYGNEKEYLRSLVKMIKAEGITVPLFTSDGSWDETLRAGSLVEDGILATGNFGSKAAENFRNMKAYFDEKNVKMPMMCMEFWDGWFNRYNEPIIRRSPQEFAEVLEEMVSLGSLNFYMFQGGTNFGFMNGCSSRGLKRLPQVTSYDYDALLTEWGDPTEKYKLAQAILSKYSPVSEPRLLAKTSGTGQLTKTTNLFDVLDKISTPQHVMYPKTMEAFDQYYGYILYRTTVYSAKKEQRGLLMGAQDRVHIFVNQQLVKTLYQEELLTDFMLDMEIGDNQIDILVENMGRVNYGPLLQSEGQHKGINRGFMMDIHFESDWTIYTLPLDNIEELKNETDSTDNKVGHFYHYDVNLNQKADTFLDITEFGKGVAFLNGVNLGRYWNVGPIGYLYIPAPLLREVDNELVIFETEKELPKTIKFRDHPVYIETENQDNFKKATAPI